MTVSSSPTVRLLTLSVLRGIGPVALKKIAAIPGFDAMEPETLASHVPSLKKALSHPDAWSSASKLAQEQLDAASRDGARVLSGVDPEYPRLLLETPDDPFVLFVKGRLAPVPENSVAIIGTREPTPHGELIAQRISAFFAEKGWSIVSGLAIGCDAIAHKTALEFKAHTVAVLAHGLQTIAPSRHKALAQEILDSGGALVTEYRYGQEVQKQQYVKRDRIQAGLAQGVVMVQSDLVGGSLHASRASIEYGRWLAAPAATDRDREQREPKVQANLLLASDDDSARADLLRCPVSALRNVFILRSREDYNQLLAGKGAELPRVEPKLSQAPPDLKPTDPATSELLARALRARYQYVRSKISEVETLQQCLSDPTTSVTAYDVDHELETVLMHLDRFAAVLADQLAVQRSTAQAAAQFRGQVAALNKQLSPVLHGSVPHGEVASLFAHFRSLATTALQDPNLAENAKADDVAR